MIIYYNLFMNAPRVMGIDEYEGQLLFRSVVGNMLIYLTEGELCLLRVGGPTRKESIRLKGRNFLGFAASARGYVALLDRRSVEIRRVDALGEVLHRFGNITIAS